MIQPDEIVDKAQRLYPKAVSAVLSGDNSLFPYRMPCNLKPPTSHSDLIRFVENLRQRSKQVIGYGYSVTYVDRNSRDHSQNYFPESITIESMEDLVRLIRKTTELSHLMNSVKQIRQRLPELEPWIIESWRKLLAVSDPIEQLIDVTLWLRANPWPNCFPREIPLPISSKLVENNWALLSKWWHRCLPATQIDYSVDPADYAQQFGFRAAEPQFLVRWLDDRLPVELGIDLREFSVSAPQLDQLVQRSASLRRVIIVENKVNLLTFPRCDGSLTMGGLGFGVTQLRQLSHLQPLELVYWGDLDVEGFQALSQFRKYFPSVRSWLMDLQAIRAFEQLGIPGNNSKPVSLPNLTDSEQAAFNYCRDHNLRLEQERITQRYVLERLGEIIPFDNNF